MTAASDFERAIATCWQCLADSACEHDVEHERRAWAELRRLQQRDDDALVE